MPHQAKPKALALECKETRPEGAIDHLLARVTQAAIALVRLRNIRDKIQKMGFWAFTKDPARQPANRPF